MATMSTISEKNVVVHSCDHQIGKWTRYTVQREALSREQPNYFSRSGAEQRGRKLNDCRL